MHALLFLSSDGVSIFFFCWKFGRFRYTHQIFRDQITSHSSHSLTHIKSWQNGLASHRRCSTCVHLAFCLATHLRGLAFTLVDLKLIRTQGDASFSPFGHPTQNGHKWIASHLYLREIYGLFRLAWTCEPIWPSFASPYISLGFANLRQPLSRT